MWLIRAALRRPDHDPGRGDRRRADGGLRGQPDARGHLSGSRSAGHLRRAAVRRDEPGADGGVHHVLLRVPLPLRQRHRERRVEVDPEHQPAEADVSCRDRHGGGARADDRLRQSRARVHAARARSARSSCGSTPAPCRSAISCSPARAAASARFRTSRSTASARSLRRCPGLTSPPPFGGSQRTIVIRVDPDRLRSYGMSPDEVIRAVTAGNVIMPSGSVNIGDETRISPMNSVVVEHQRSARAADPHRRRPAGVDPRRRHRSATAPTSRRRTRWSTAGAPSTFR